MHRSAISSLCESHQVYLHRPRQYSLLHTLLLLLLLLLPVLFSSGNYCHAPHNDILVNDGPHIGRWSHKLQYYIIIIMGRDSSVGIATRYWLDGPRIESRWGRDFPSPSRPALGPVQPPIHWVANLSRG